MSRLIPYEERYKRFYSYWTPEVQYWKDYAEEMAIYLDNTHASIRRHRDQLHNDFNIIYDAPCDLYRKFDER